MLIFMIYWEKGRNGGDNMSEIIIKEIQQKIETQGVKNVGIFVDFITFLIDNKLIEESTNSIGRKGYIIKRQYLA